MDRRLIGNATATVLAITLAVIMLLHAPLFSESALSDVAAKAKSHRSAESEKVTELPFHLAWSLSDGGEMVESRSTTHQISDDIRLDVLGVLRVRNGSFVAIVTVHDAVSRGLLFTEAAASRSLTNILEYFASAWDRVNDSVNVRDSKEKTDKDFQVASL